MLKPRNINKNMYQVFRKTRPETPSRWFVFRYDISRTLVD